MTAAYTGHIVGLEDAPPLRIPHMKKGVRRKYEEAARLARQANWLIHQAVDEQYGGSVRLRRGNMHLEALYASGLLQDITFQMERGAVVRREWDGATEVEVYANGVRYTTRHGDREAAERSRRHDVEQAAHERAQRAEFWKRRDERGLW